jgi:hypothetical protein
MRSMGDRLKITGVMIMISYVIAGIIYRIVGDKDGR